MISQATLDAFEEGLRSDVLPFVMSDIVRILDGERKGSLAWVISLEAAGEMPMYRVEFGDGSESVHPAKNLLKVEQGEAC